MFNKTDAFDIQADYETYAILRYNSKQKLIFRTLSVKVKLMYLMYLLIITLNN